MWGGVDIHGYGQGVGPIHAWGNCSSKNSGSIPAQMLAPMACEAGAKFGGGKRVLKSPD